MNVVENTSNITLHAKNLNISTDSLSIYQLNGNNQRQFSINRTEAKEEFDFFIIHTNEILEKDAQYEVFIPFKSDLSKGLLGFYRSSYLDKQTKEKR